MTGIFSGIQNIIESIINIYDNLKLAIQFLMGIIEGLFNLLELLETVIATAINIILTLPPWLLAVTMTTMSVSILYMIIGRDTGK